MPRWLLEQMTQTFDAGCIVVEIAGCPAAKAQHGQASGEAIDIRSDYMRGIKAMVAGKARNSTPLFAKVKPCKSKPAI
jgi:hypothetical protein